MVSKKGNKAAGKCLELITPTKGDREGGAGSHKRHQRSWSSFKMVIFDTNENKLNICLLMQYFAADVVDGEVDRQAQGGAGGKGCRCRRRRELPIWIRFPTIDSPGYFKSSNSKFITI